MAIIDPVPLDQLDPEKFQTRLDLAQDLMVPDTLFIQIMAHAPGYGEALFDAMYQSHAIGNVDHTLKEIIRVRLARLAKDDYFGSLRSKKATDLGLTEARIEAGCGDFESDEQFSAAEKWAITYAKLMYTEPTKVNADFYNLGKTFYTEPEIMELGAFIAFHYGLQMFMRTLKMLPLDAA
jgi:alkylhydroperoxidase family enzyme